MRRTLLFLAGVLAFAVANAQVADIQAPPELLDAPFGIQDEQNFQTPPKVFWPETWFHFIGTMFPGKASTQTWKPLRRQG